MSRRLLSISLALLCSISAPTSARASGPAASENVEARAEALFTAGKPLEAARTLADALNDVPERIDSRGQRNSWATGAVNAYRLAFDADPTQCSVLTAGLALADRYLEGLIAVYGEQATTADDYVGMHNLRAELDQARLAHACPEPARPAATPPEPEPAPAPAPVRPPAAPPEALPAPPPRGLAVGLGVSATLMVGMAVGSLTTYLQIRRPDGTAYQTIYDAALANNVANDASTDLCTAGQANAEVASACRGWRSRKQAFIATTALAGAFAVSTAVFAGLLAKHRRRPGRAATLLRRHQAQLGATPHRGGGASLAAGFRF